MGSYKYPYYIVAPRYTRTSGGVRVLYRLADLINKAGGSAFIFLRPDTNHDLASSPCDVAPFLNKKIVDYHFKSGLTPIVVYPEIVNITKFLPPVRVRYILNYNELIFRNEPLENDDYLLSFSLAIDDEITVDKPRRTLFLPISDPNFFSPPTPGGERIGAAYYAGKYKYRFGGKTFSVTNGCTEITRDRPDSQTPEQIRDLFRRIELFYCYEDSALALEAILCGCPTVFLPNEHFQRPLGAAELDGLGFAWGDSPDQIAHAKRTVVAAREAHLRRVNEIHEQILYLMNDTQVLAERVPYLLPFGRNYLKSPGLCQRSIDTFRLLRDVVNDFGWGGTYNIVKKRIVSRRFKV